MTYEEAATILSEHNKWRRGEPPYDEMGKQSPQTPKEVGEAIEFAVIILGELAQ